MVESIKGTTIYILFLFMRKTAPPAAKAITSTRTGPALPPERREGPRDRPPRFLPATVLTITTTITMACTVGQRHLPMGSDHNQQAQRQSPYDNGNDDDPSLYASKTLLRGTIVNKTYGSHKNLPGIHFPFFNRTRFGPVHYGPPQ